METNPIFNYFDVTSMHFVDQITKRLNKLKNEYIEKKFGLKFFLDIEVENCRIDLIYMRDAYLKVHLSLCRANKLPKEQFAIKHVQRWYNKLNDVEIMSFIQIMQLKDSWFGLSQKTKDKMNFELSEIAKKIIAEMNAKENINNLN